MVIIFASDEVGSRSLALTCERANAPPCAITGLRWFRPVDPVAISCVFVGDAATAMSTVDVPLGRVHMVDRDSSSFGVVGGP